MFKKFYVLNIFITSLIIQIPSQASLVETEYELKNWGYPIPHNFPVKEYPEITLDCPLFDEAKVDFGFRKFNSENEAIEAWGNKANIITHYPSWKVYKDKNSNHYVLSNKFILFTSSDLFPDSLKNKTLRELFQHFGMASFKGKSIQSDGFYSGMYQHFNPEVGLVKFDLTPVRLDASKLTVRASSSAAFAATISKAQE